MDNYAYRDHALTVETADFFFRQAYNGHIMIYRKANGRPVMHINCTTRYSPKELHAFADRFQSINGNAEKAVRAQC